MLLAGKAAIPHALDLDEIRNIRSAVEQVKADDAAVELLLDVHAAATKEGHDISDRRLRKSLKVLRAHAYVCGADEVSADHFEILADVFWIKPDGRADLAALIRKIANPTGHRAQELLDGVKEEFRKLPFAEQDRAGLSTAQISALAIEVKGKLKRAAEKLAALKNGKPTPKVDAAIAEVNRMSSKAVELYSSLMAGV
jgi:MoxR-like ATPase